MGRRVSLLTVINAMERAGRQAARDAERRRRAQERLCVQQQKLAYLSQIEQCKDEAERETKKAQNSIMELENLLLRSLYEEYSVDWGKLKDRSKFLLPEPVREEIVLPSKPDLRSKKYQIGFWMSVYLFFCIKEFQEEKRAEKQKLYERDVKRWKKKVDALKKQQKKLDEDFKQVYEHWKQEKICFSQNQEDYNRKIEENKSNYLKGNFYAQNVEQYYELIFNQVTNPDCFGKDYEFNYNSENKLLVINYYLPVIEELPNIKEVKFIRSSHQFKTTCLSDTYLKKMYEDVVYQCVFKIINVVFANDQADAVEAVAFNGRVNAVDQATGKEIDACIASVQVTKEDFRELYLDKIDAKQAFKRLKGVSSARLDLVTPVNPILYQA